MNGNKLIAEFMGLETSDRCFFEHLTKEGNRELTHHVLLKYHISWDWLIPVVEKIESLGYEFTIVESRCNINHNTDHSVEELFHIETIGSKLDTTYDAVVQFINQYNKTI